MRKPPVGDPVGSPLRVVRHHGSAPGELAACLRNVGLARRADLTAVPAAGPAATIAAVSADLTGVALAVGGCRHAAGTWWCRPGARTLVYIGAPGAVARTLDVLRMHARRRPALALATDVELTALSLIGRQTATLLGELGVLGRLGDARTVPPCVAAIVAGARTVWLLESDESALCLLDRADAAAVEQRIASAGRTLRLARVGHDALARYRLLERRRADVALRGPA